MLRIAIFLALCLCLAGTVSAAVLKFLTVPTPSIGVVLQGNGVNLLANGALLTE